LRKLNLSSLQKTISWKVILNFICILFFIFKFAIVVPVSDKPDHEICYCGEVQDGKHPILIRILSLEQRSKTQYSVHFSQNSCACPSATNHDEQCLPSHIWLTTVSTTAPTPAATTVWVAVRAPTAPIDWHTAKTPPATVAGPWIAAAMEPAATPEHREQKGKF
jgi:hypothetical protein